MSAEVGDYVRLGLHKGGVFLDWIVRKTDNDGSYTWKIPGEIEAGSDYTMRVQSYENNGIRDFSDEAFSISAAPVLVTYPFAHEEWAAGDIMPITWQTSGEAVGPAVRIALHIGQSFHSWINRRTDNDGLYRWIIPEDTATDSRYKIRVQSYDVNELRDFSDGRFTITQVPLRVLTPNGGEHWPIGTTQAITWESPGGGVGDYVRIGLHKEGAFDRWLNLRTENDGEYLWIVADDLLPRPDYTIRVQSYDDNTVRDFSDGNFSITAAP